MNWEEMSEEEKDRFLDAAAEAVMAASKAEPRRD
jgi:hypothetical protein